MLNAIVMSVLLVAGLAVFAALIVPRLRLLLRAQPDPRFDRLGARLVGTIQYALAQWRLPRDPIAGVAHMFIFWGFLAVALATFTHFVHAYAPGWHLPGLGGRLGLLYSLLKEVFEVLVVLAVLWALWRRLKPGPTRVARSWEGTFVLVMILLLMITDFAIAGGEQVVTGAGGWPWSPAGHLAGLALAPLGTTAAHGVAITSWWIHCVAILVFLNFLPLGKHFHVITSIPKVFFRSLEPPGTLEKVDLEASESFGLRSSADLTWSMVLDTYSCTECGRCTVYCPTALTAKPLTHRQLNLDLKHSLYDDRAAILSGDAKKLEELPGLLPERVTPETIWACTTCGSCEQECPLFIENVPRIVKMRQYKVLMEGDLAPELARSFRGMENNQNPWGIGRDQRDAWAEGLDIPRMADVIADGKPPPLLYWVGCAGSFDDRIKKTTLAVVKILRAAGVEFAILGQEEGCTGDAARRAGNEYLFQAMAMANVELLNGYGVKRILTHCPHCMFTFKVDYPQLGGNYEVIHHSQLIAALIDSGQLKLSKEVARAVAWHDSCYLGRYQEIYEAPRRALQAVPGVKLVELPRNRSRAVCCGAGGGRFWLEEKIGERINVHRSKEALTVGTDTIGSSCPFCLTMLKDGVADLGKDDDVKTLDLAEIVAQALP